MRRVVGVVGVNKKKEKVKKKKKVKKKQKVVKEVERK